MQKVNWHCRYAPSLGALEGTPTEVWGLPMVYDFEDPVVYFGLYSLNDFNELRNDLSKRKAILWAGSDIKHFINGYWLDDEGKIRIDPLPLAQWISENCESYTENMVEADALRELGIESQVVPSFMGNVNDYDLEYVWDERPKVYLSVSGDNFEMYGWTLIEEIADKCNVDFFLYGNRTPYESKHTNVFVRGRVPKEVMNEEVKKMQCGLRTLEFDGFSEILAKSILWGQHPISYIEYPHIESFKTREELIKKLNNLVTKKSPNIEGREYYLKHLNNYPWNAKN